MENRYIVLKQTDVDAALDNSEKLELSSLMMKVYKKRIESKKPLEAVVVESDWPEYKPTCRAIEKRIERETKLSTMEQMFGKGEFFTHFYVIETPRGIFLVNSDAHSVSRLRNYSGYQYRAITSVDGSYDPNVILKTGWSTGFGMVVKVSSVDIVNCYEPNRLHGIGEKLIAFMEEQIRVAKNYE